MKEKKKIYGISRASKIEKWLDDIRFGIPSFIEKEKIKEYIKFRMNQCPMKNKQLATDILSRIIDFDISSSLAGVLLISSIEVEMEMKDQKRKIIHENIHQSI